MKIGKTLYITKGEKWRSWLAKNYNKEKEIWLIYYKKSSGKPRIPYNSAVEEALCYGWIDSIIKKLDEERFVQRFTPRNPKSTISEMNLARIKNLIKKKKMTPAGLKVIKNSLKNNPYKKFIVPKDILKEIKKNKQTWINFQNLPESYKKIRIAYIEGVRKRSKKEFNKRLNNFIKLTSKNKRFGFVKEMR